ncbi:hypothetical protein I6I97_02095 [Sphingobacterium multivorum]|uniref:hypothetical protein n=1 Tax=Sphingobacterium multivorum TaxID=28454 RepID=UPI001918B82D|nr:hypothetical protein [Sphingobacterium multivorum]QQT62633.1 hypothetical protein I6I97_02095 [Sphingobacterium multivorum]
MANNDAIKELLDHLKNELEKNGFGEVVRLVGIRMANDDQISALSLERDFYRILVFFLNQTIDILHVLSSASVKQTIKTLNNSLEDGRIKKIQVELLSGDYLDLEDLPNYTALIADMESILEEFKDYF